MKKSKSLEAVMSELYDSGINVAIFSFLPDGFEAKIGDEKAGIRAEAVFNSATIKGVTGWLIDQARKHYPRSQFSKVDWA